MSRWEHLIVALPDFKAASTTKGESASVVMLDREGDNGWEAAGMTTRGDGHVAVLMKRQTQARP